MVGSRDLAFRRTMTTIFTNGCFDILHADHLAVLDKCRYLTNYYDTPQPAQCIIAINSDDSYERLKGRRPIKDQNTRAGLLSSWADQVIIFENDTPIDVIRSIKPTIIVKGGDYTNETVVGHEMARVEIVPLVEGMSITSILERIRNSE